MAGRKSSYTKSKGVRPSTKRGRIAVKRLGRSKKTGGFARIARGAAKRYGSKLSGKKVAGKVYWSMVRKRK